MGFEIGSETGSSPNVPAYYGVQKNLGVNFLASVVVVADIAELVAWEGCSDDRRVPVGEQWSADTWPGRERESDGDADSKRSHQYRLLSPQAWRLGDLCRAPEPLRSR